MLLFAPRLFPFFVAIGIAQFDFICVYVKFLFVDCWLERKYVIYYAGDEIIKIYIPCIDFSFADAFFNKSVNC